MNYSQTGSAHTFLIIGLLIALVGAVGFIFWQNFIHEEPIPTKTEVVKVDKKNNDKEIEPSIQPPSQPPDIRLQELYNQYLADASSYMGDSGLAAFKQAGYIAEDYISENNSGEPLICGQEAYPSSMQVKLIEENDDNATLEANKIYDDGSSASNGLLLTMSLNDSNQWQLQKTACTTK